LELCITLEQSPNSLHGEFTDVPNDLNIYLIVMAPSVASFMALNSAPYVDVAIAPWHLDFHIIGVLPTKVITPDIDLPVTLSCP